MRIIQVENQVDGGRVAFELLKEIFRRGFRRQRFIKALNRHLKVMWLL